MTFAARMSSALVVAMMLLPGAGALAFEPTGNAVGDRFLKMFEASGMTDLAYESAASSGDLVSIKRLTGTLSDRGGTLAFKASGVTLTGGTIDSEGGLALNHIKLTGVSMRSASTSYAVESMVSTGLKFPATATIGTPDAERGSVRSYKSSVLTGISLATDDGLYMPISEFRVLNTDFVDGIPRNMVAAISNIAVTTANLPNGMVRQSLGDLGYEEIRFDIAAQAEWDDKTGALALPRLTVTGKDFGELTLRLRLGGWTKALMRDVVNIEIGDPKAIRALIGKLQKTSIERISLDVDNDSVVDRLLDHKAQRAGLGRGQYVDRAMSSLAAPLAAIRNPKFAKMISSQLGIFLADPQTFSLLVAPAAPVPLARIFLMVAFAPQSVPKKLGVTLQANRK